jgi:homoaconitase/3-isopropylmalate dehydratase large subunit
MGMTIAEKILAKKSGLDSVVPGRIVDAYPDLVMSHTATWRSVTVMEKVGATKLYDPDRIAVVLDHIAPAKSEKNAADHLKCRNFVKKYGIKKFYDVNAGIAHLVLMEAGHVGPGDLIVGTDSHCTIYGSLGALGSGIGYTEVTSVWITGKLWMKVPESYKIVLRGKFPKGVYSKDLMLYLIGTLGADGCNYMSVEFYGDTVQGLSISERMTVTNLAMEMGVKCAFIPPDRAFVSRGHRGSRCGLCKRARRRCRQTATYGCLPSRSREYKAYSRGRRNPYRPGVSRFLRECEV